MDRYKAKLKLARRLRTPAEEHNKTPLFQTAAWEIHKNAVHNKVMKNELAAELRRTRRELEKRKAQKQEALT